MYENHEETTRGPQEAPRYDHQGPQHARTPERKSPLVAVMLSAMPGLGQVYVGYYQRGFFHIAVVATTIMLLNTRGFNGLEPLLGVFLAFFWIYNMIDAARCASAVNRGADAGLQPELPELPSGIGGGSVFAGVLLVAVGAILLGRTLFDVSLEWLADWWPAFLVIFGVRMIVTGARRKG